MGLSYGYKIQENVKRPTEKTVMNKWGRRIIS